MRSAAFARRVPINLGGRSRPPSGCDGYQPAPDEDMSILFNNVSPDYFRTIGIALSGGREFQASDAAKTGNA